MKEKYSEKKPKINNYVAKYNQHRGGFHSVRDKPKRSKNQKYDLMNDAYEEFGDI